MRFFDVWHRRTIEYFTWVKHCDNELEEQFKGGELVSLITKTYAGCQTNLENGNKLDTVKLLERLCKTQKALGEGNDKHCRDYNEMMRYKYELSLQIGKIYRKILKCGEKEGAGGVRRSYVQNLNWFVMDNIDCIDKL